MSTNEELSPARRFRPSRTAWIVTVLAVIAVMFGSLAWSASQPVVPAPVSQVAQTPSPDSATPGQVSDGTRVPDATSSTAASAPAVDLSLREEPIMTREPQAAPVRLSVPSVGISTNLEDLGLLDDGTLATPVDTDLAGWYAGGPRPGAVGPAVVAGHVSWNGDPSIFFRLSEVAIGDAITVEQADGAEVNFRVTRVEQHPKDDFPTLSVYGNTAGPELRLITCGGEFNADTGHFYDNVIVFAEMEDA